MIQESPLHNVFGESAISKIARWCEDKVEIADKVRNLFLTLTANPIDIKLSSDRESFFSTIHVLRFSSNVKEICGHFQSTDCPNLESVNAFVQVLIMEFTNSFLATLSKTMKSKSETEVSQNLSENTQKILFYIAGYIINALKKKYFKLTTTELKEKKMALLKSLSCSTNNSKFIENISAWFEKKNRGGLKRPCDNFFLLLRSSELVLLKNNPSVLHTRANSIRNCEIKEKIMEDFMVKYYREKLFRIPDDENDIHDKVTDVVFEDIINLFITIRGFAVQRVQRSKILKTVEKKRSGDSFRQALKSKQNVNT